MANLNINFSCLLHLLTISLTVGELLRMIFISVPCLSVKTLDLRNEHRTWFGNMNSYGHIHPQTWFCGRYHRWEHRPSVLAAAVILLPSSSPAPYTFRTADEVFCKENKWGKISFLMVSKQKLPLQSVDRISYQKNP